MKLIILLTSLILSTTTQAQSLMEMIDLSEQVFTIPVDLSTTKVKVTTLGYGGVPTLKVLIPELAAITILDHRNEGEEAPCMATFEAFTVEDVVQGDPATINSDITVTRKKMVTPIASQQICKVQLVETITTNIRGLNFIHSESQILPDRHIDDCK